ncbi:MAG TPA: heme-binding protein, partial [Verrucomicrobiae bacterium]|nr:heme-binding protein [Verrucomicrobiae bacterium]
MRNFKYGHILDVLALLAVAGALPVFPAHAGQGVGYTQQRGLTLAILNRIALGAIEACEAKGYTVSATIVDREGVTRVSLMGDGAGPVSVSTSYRKAYTAAALGITTAKFREMVETPGAGPILSIDPL